MARPFRVPLARLPLNRVPLNRSRGALRAGVAAAAMAAGLAAPAQAGPSGGTVKGGEATIVTRGDLTVVRQGSRRVIIDWTSFDIGADEAVKFLQPGRQAVALNRVLDGLPTHIRGKLTANGNVWLVNPSGVMFHAGSVVDVGGLIATTADIDDRAFMAGGGAFDTPGEPGARIVNEGTITFAEAGMVGLVAPEVANRGVIAGKMGRIVVAGQESFSVDVSGDGLFEIDLADAARTRGARAENSGVLIAEGGTVIITAAAARDAVEAAVSVGGVVEASSARVDGGTIVLDGGAGDVVVTGRLDASGGAGSRGGRVDVTGGTVRLAEGARIDVSGGTGGGAVRVGGSGPAPGGLRAAEVTVMEAGAEIRADAEVEGDGGEVTLWSTAATWMGGRIAARGGAAGGDGGFAEISSLGALGFSGRVDLSAPRGSAGLLLLDPRDVRIVAEDEDAYAFSGDILVDQFAGEDLVVLASAISSSFADVRIEASRDISVESGIANRRPNVDLTLSAGRDLLLGASIVMRGTLTLTADAGFASQASDGVGAIRVLGALRLESSFAELRLSAPEGIDGSAMAPGDLLTLDTSEGLVLPDVALAGGLVTTSLGPTTTGAISAHLLEMEALSLTLGGPAAVTGESRFATAGGGFSALDAGNAFGGAVSIDTTAGGTAAPGDATLVAGGDLTLGATTVGALTLEVGGALTQTGALSVAGDAALAGASIDLSFSDNDFAGVVAAGSAGLVSLADADAIRLGQVDAGALTVVSQDGIDQAAGTRVSVAGATALTTGGGAVTLEAAGNVFGGGLGVDTTAGGAAAADVRVATGGALALAGVTADRLSVEAGGALTQTGALSLGAGAELTSASFTLRNAANDFGDVLQLDGGAARLRSAGGVSFGASSLASLELTAGGDIGQVGALSVAGTSRFETSGDVILEAANAFDGAVSIAGAAVSITDADALSLVSVEAGETLSARALDGDLTMEQVRVGGGGGALWGGADGGSIRLVSALAGDTVLAGIEGAATGDVVVDTAALGSLQIVAAGGGDVDGVRLTNLVLDGDLGIAKAPNVTLDGVTLGTDAAFDPGEATGGLTLHRVRVAGDLVAAVQGDIRLGLVETVAGAEGAGTLDLTSLGGSIRKLSDAAIDFGAAEAGSGALSILAPDGKEVSVEAAALAPYADLLATAGDLRLDATGDVLLPRAEQGVGTLDAGPGPLRVRVGGAAELSAGGDLALAHAGDLTLAGLSVAGDAAIRTVEGGALEQTGAASVGGRLALEVAGDATLTRRDNAFATLSGRVGGTLAARDADGFTLADLRAGAVSVAGQAGAVALRDVATEGALAVEADAVSALRLESGGALGLVATDAGAEGADLQAAGELAMTAAGDVTLARFVAGSLALSAGGDLAVQDGAAGAATATAGGEASLANLRLGAAEVEAGGALSALAIRAQSLALDAGGDMTLGGVATVGDLTATAQGRIDTVAAPAELASVRVAGVRGAVTGLDVDARLDEARLGRQTTTLAPGADATLAAEAIAEVLGVGGAASFSGRDGVTVIGEGARGVRIDGEATLVSGGDARLETAGAIRFASVDVTGDLFARSNAYGGVFEDAGISQTGAVRVGGHASLQVGPAGGGTAGDVVLDRADNAFATLELEARHATLRDADGFAIARGALLGRLTIGAGEAAQAGPVSVSDLSAAGGAWVRATGEVSGAELTLGAASRFRSVSGSTTLSDVAATGLLEGMAGNDVALARISADALSVEAEGDAGLSQVAAATLDARAGGDMRWTDVTAQEAEGRAPTGDLTLIRVAADTATLAAETLSISDSDFGTLQASAGVSAALDGVRAEAASVDAGAGATLSAVEAGTLSVTALDSLSLTDVQAGTLSTIAGLGFAWTDVTVEGAAVGEAWNGGATLSGVSAAEATIRARGDATVDGSGFGALGLTALGDATLRDVNGGTLVVFAGRDFGGEGGTASVLSEGGAIGEGTAILARVSAETAEVTAAADARVRDSGFGRLAMQAGRDGVAAGVTAGRLESVAARDLSWTDVSADLAVGEATAGSAQIARLEAGEARLAAGLDLGVTDSALGRFEGTAGRDLSLARVATQMATATAGRDLSTVDVETGSAGFASGRDMMVRRLAGETLTLDADGALSATSLSAATATLAAGRRLDGARIRAGALEAQAGGAMTLADLTHGSASLAAGGALSLARAQGGALTATAASAVLSDLAVARLEATAEGDLTARKVQAEGRVQLAGQGVAITDLSAGGAIEALATGDLTAARVRGEGDVALAAGDRARLDQVSAGRRLSALAEGEGGEGPALVLGSIETRHLAADAGGVLDLDGVAARGDVQLSTRSGDLLLGALEVGGTLAALAEAGSIRTRLGTGGTDLWTVAGPGAPQGPAAPRGLPGEGEGEIIVRITAPEPGAEFGGDPVTVAGHGFANLVRVGGDAVFDASGSVLLAAEEGGAGRDNDFRGGVGVSRARHVAISDANDLRIGAAGAEGLVNRVSGERLETVHLRAGGDVTDAGAARIRTSGDVYAQAGGDVRLTSGLHAFGGAFAAQAGTVEVATAGDLRLGPIRASSRLSVLAGASGEGYASITQTGAARVTRLGMVEGVAADGMIDLAGPIRVDGPAGFATGADPTRTAVDKGADLTLDDPTNVFGGDVSIRRIFGDVTLIEESAPGSLHVDEHDAGWLRFAGFEAGGDVLIRTSDNVAFLGRLTALTDDMDPAGPLAPPRAAGPADWRAQGGALAQDDLRLFLPDGTVFAIDATAGGADPAGGTVRFDRPVDGANRLSSARDEDAAAARGDAGALVIDAGAQGDVRFRDYVGASNPLGAVVIQDARNVSLGHTFADRDARPSDDPDRFLLQGEGQSVDIFTSGPIVVDARGAVEIYMPAGLLELYEQDDDYFGLNTPVLIYGDRTQPESLSLFGYIGDSGKKAAGLYPIGPKGVNFLLNGCVIGDVQDCTGVSPPRVLALVSVDQPEILNVDEEDLLELFVSYGNEELWGVPDGYFEDSDLARARSETNRQASGDEDEDDEDDAPAAGGRATGGDR